jgi:hypothetical protein
VQHDATPPRDATRDANLAPHDANSLDTRAEDGPHAHDAGGDAPDDGSRDGADAPSTTTLAVSLTLVPTFSADIHDYYVRCAAGGSSVTVTMTAAPGSVIGLTQPIVTAAARASTITVEVDEGAAIVAVVTPQGAVDAGSAADGGDGGPDEYWVRCLPNDFAGLDMIVHPDAGAVVPGYYLVGNIFSIAPVVGGYAMALDVHGVPVWYSKTVSGVEPVDVESLIPGTISFNPYIEETFSSVADGAFEIHDLASSVTTFASTVSYPLDPHELRVLPDGDYVMIAAPVLTGVDLTGLERFGENEYVEGCVVQEVDPTAGTGRAVWEWNAMDHLDPVIDSTYPVVNAVDGKAVIAVFHCNSVDVLPGGDLLVSLRNMDSVVRVSRATGAVLWKMGGSAYTVDGAPYIRVANDPMTSFYRQHDVRMLPDGTISMFDDRTGATGGARAVIYGVDLATETATVVWQYAGGQASEGMGGFRVLPDGSRTICWGIGAPGLAFTEVDEDGNDLLDLHFTDSEWTYRAVKIPTSAIDIRTLRTATGAP